MPIANTPFKWKIDIAGNSSPLPAGFERMILKKVKVYLRIKPSKNRAMIKRLRGNVYYDYIRLRQIIEDPHADNEGLIIHNQYYSVPPINFTGSWKIT